MLTSPSMLEDFTGTGNSNTFTARSGVTLDREKTYLVVVEVEGGSLEWVGTDADDEDSDTARGRGIEGCNSCCIRAS